MAQLIAAQLAWRWQRCSAGAGAHGERFYDWIRVRVSCGIAGRRGVVPSKDVLGLSAPLRG